MVLKSVVLLVVKRLLVVAEKQEATPGSNTCGVLHGKLYILELSSSFLFQQCCASWSLFFIVKLAFYICSFVFTVDIRIFKPSFSPHFEKIHMKVTITITKNNNNNNNNTQQAEFLLQLSSAQTRPQPNRPVLMMDKLTAQTAC